MRAALFLSIAAMVMASCTTSPDRDTPTRAVVADSTLPPMKVFANARPRPPVMSNSDIAGDFMALHFQLESGRSLETFTRFEGPITVRVTGAPPASLDADLHRLLLRLRKEAGIDIRQAHSGTANITIEAIPRDEIRRSLPLAACFVVPNVSSLAEFRRDRRKSKTNWALLEKRERLAIFVPNDTSPQEVRDCLHEELAQALGPLNDLYRLSDSVFNDDNVHRVLTGFDMLILRTTYAPELRTGMSRADVAAQLPRILARYNPNGSGKPRVGVEPTPRVWINAVQTALGPGASPNARRAAADTALITAQEHGWTDHRRAFSHYMVGRLAQVTDPELAEKHYVSAMYYLDRTPRTEVQQAYIITQTAALDISRGDPARALARLNPAIETAAQSENAALLSTLMLLKAEALELLGRPDQARAVRLDSLGWARYGFGADWAVKQKMREISALNPLKRSDGQI
ncbi:MAG: ATP-dependent transcriptional regulator [Rhodobacteraceae bacterium]|nr:ATP-dependent transcriptional regulator [Paracoccaceae bacterium]